MAIASLGSIGSANDKTAGTTVAFTVTQAVAAGSVVLVVMGSDNSQTTDGATTQLSVADSKGNTYTRVVEHNMGAGGADLGALGAIFRSVLTTALTTSDTVTGTNSSSEGAMSLTGHAFSVGAGSTIAVQASTADPSPSSADPPAITLSSLTSRPYLLVWAGIFEGQPGVLTNDADYTSTLGADDGTSGGSADTNIVHRARYRLATLTTDTVDVTTATDRDHVQLYAAIYEVAVVGAASTVSGGGGGLVSATAARANVSTARGGGAAASAVRKSAAGVSACRGGGAATSVGQKDEAGGLLDPSLDKSFSPASGSTYTMDEPVAADARIILGVSWYDDAKTLASGSGGSLTWEIVRQVKHPDNGERIAIVTAYAPDGLADNSVFTPSWSGGGSPAFGPRYVGSSWLNLTDAATEREDDDGSGQYDTTWAVSALTVANDKVLIYALGEAPFFSASPTPNHTPATNYTELHQYLFSSTEMLVDLYRIVTSGAAGSYTPGGTYSDGGGVALNLEIGVAFIPATGAGAPDESGSSTVRGGGSLTATAAKAVSGASSVRGGGTCAATVRKNAAAISSVRGGGSATSTVRKTGATVSTVRGGGALVAASRKGGTGISTVRGGGTGVAAGQQGAQQPGAISGGGSVVSTGRKAATAVSAVRGGGTVSSVGTAALAKSGTSDVRGGGTVTGAASAARSTTSSVRGGGTVSGTGFGALAKSGSSSVRGGGSVASAVRKNASTASTVRGGGFVLSAGTAATPRSGASSVRGGGRTFAAAAAQRMTISTVRGGGFVLTLGSSARRSASHVRGGGFVLTVSVAGQPATPAVTTRTRAGGPSGMTNAGNGDGSTDAGGGSGMTQAGAGTGRTLAGMGSGRARSTLEEGEA